jgi:hypothetical protein
MPGLHRSLRLLQISSGMRYLGALPERSQKTLSGTAPGRSYLTDHFLWAFAKEHNIFIGAINLETTPPSGISDLAVLGKAGDLLPQLLD